MWNNGKDGYRPRQDIKRAGGGANRDPFSPPEEKSNPPPVQKIFWQNVPDFFLEGGLEKGPQIAFLHTFFFDKSAEMNPKMNQKNILSGVKRKGESFLVPGVPDHGPQEE